MKKGQRYDVLAELEARARKLDAEIDDLRARRRELARAIEAETQRLIAARTPIPGPKIG